MISGSAGVGVVEADFFFLRSRSGAEGLGDGLRLEEEEAEGSSLNGDSEVVCRLPCFGRAEVDVDVDGTGLASRAEVGVVPRIGADGLVARAEPVGLAARPYSGLIARPLIELDCRLRRGLVPRLSAL